MLRKLLSTPISQKTKKTKHYHGISILGFLGLNSPRFPCLVKLKVLFNCDNKLVLLYYTMQDVKGRGADGSLLHVTTQLHVNLITTSTTLQTLHQVFPFSLFITHTISESLGSSIGVPPKFFLSIPSFFVPPKFFTSI